jgi:hypothetical protein
MAKTYSQDLNDKSIEVLEETNKIYLEQSITRNNLLDAENYVQFLSFILSKATFGMAKEIFRDAVFGAANVFESSLFLAQRGFYRSANSELRTALEYFLITNYFDLLDVNNELKGYWVDKEYKFVDWKSPDVVEKSEDIAGVQRTYIRSGPIPDIEGVKHANPYVMWDIGQKYVDKIDLNPYTIKYENYPNQGKYLDYLFKDRILKSYSENYKFKKQIEDLYSKLSKATHNRKYSDSSPKVRSSIINIRYDKDSFEDYLKNAKEVYEIIYTICVLRYPKIFDEPELKGIVSKYKNIHDRVTK